MAELSEARCLRTSFALAEGEPVVTGRHLLQPKENLLSPDVIPVAAKRKRDLWNTFLLRPKSPRHRFTVLLLRLKEIGSLVDQLSLQPKQPEAHLDVICLS